MREWMKERTDECVTHLCDLLVHLAHFSQKCRVSRPIPLPVAHRRVKNSSRLMSSSPPARAAPRNMRTGASSRRAIRKLLMLAHQIKEISAGDDLPVTDGGRVEPLGKCGTTIS
ncbi:hypothetical protein FA95DRAFT_1078372 [Auriscalpium vulgare]|uniref:Uncharacterized protein n=1 Tax=Auriscalpium vulgare TaxID=40419 RepID=A0ACB8R538_9AGAM|nr:hypothetical protein FA95DRAFT_1078372 [Auriscalpium vulgare]